MQERLDKANAHAAALQSQLQMKESQCAALAGQIDSMLDRSPGRAGTDTTSEFWAGRLPGDDAASNATPAGAQDVAAVCPSRPAGPPVQVRHLPVPCG